VSKGEGSLEINGLERKENLLDREMSKSEVGKGR